MQNMMQLESSYHTNKRKWKVSEAFDDDFNSLQDRYNRWDFLTTVDELMLDDIINSRLF